MMAKHTGSALVVLLVGLLASCISLISLTAAPAKAGEFDKYTGKEVTPNYVCGGEGGRKALLTLYEYAQKAPVGDVNRSFEALFEVKICYRAQGPGYYVKIPLNKVTLLDGKLEGNAVVIAEYKGYNDALSYELWDKGFFLYYMEELNNKIGSRGRGIQPKVKGYDI